MTAATNYGVLAPSVEGLTRDNLPDRLVSFEAVRADHPDRVDIARSMTDHSLGRFEFQTDGSAPIPLPEYMQGSGDPLPLRAEMLDDRDSDAADGGLET